MGSALWFVVCVGVVAAVMCVALQLYVIDLFVRIFPRYAIYFGSKAVHQFSDQGQGRVIIIIIGYLVMAVYCIYLLSLKRNKNESNRKLYYQLKIMLFSVVIGLFGAKSKALMRMNSYFAIIAISFIPNTILIDKKYNRNILTIVTMILTATYMILFLIEDKSDVVPYSFFWEIMT